MQPQSQSIKDMGSEIASDAKSIGGKAVDRLHSEVDARKAGVASQAKSVSGAIGQVADALHPDSSNWLKSAVQQGAQQAQKLADAVEHKDSRQIVSDISDFARNSPVTFLGVCVAAGFAAARVLKAGSGEATPSQSDGYTNDHARDVDASTNAAFVFSSQASDETSEAYR